MTSLYGAFYLMRIALRNPEDRCHLIKINLTSGHVSSTNSDIGIGLLHCLNDSLSKMVTAYCGSDHQLRTISDYRLRFWLYPLEHVEIRLRMLDDLSLVLIQ